jgi:hypothetical protein
MRLPFDRFWMGCFHRIGVRRRGVGLFNHSPGLRQRRCCIPGNLQRDVLAGADHIRSRERRLPAYPQPFEPPRPGSRAFNAFMGPFLSLPPYQRIASLAFLLQSALSLVLISGFCFAQVAGLDVHVLDAPSFAALFAEAYPIDVGATFARTRFDKLFLALVALYIISLVSFAVALTHSLGPLFKGFKQHVRLLATIAVLLIGLWLLLFVGGSAGSLQRSIIHGDAFGYIVLFVFLPMIWVFVASELPDER